MSEITYKKEIHKILRSFPTWDRNDFSRNVIFYGAGSLGLLSLQVLEGTGLLPFMVLDKNKEGEIQGIPIHNADDIDIETKKESLLVICISTISYVQIVEELKEKGFQHFVHCYTYIFFQHPEGMSNGWVFEDNEFIQDKCEKVCNLLADQESIAHYLQFLWWKKSNIETVYEGFPIESGKKYFYTGLFQFKEDDVFLDGGAYYGKQTEKFVDVCRGRFQHIYQVEADPVFFDFLNGANHDSRISVINIALSDRSGQVYFTKTCEMANHISKKSEYSLDILASTIDNLALSPYPTIIKLHLEGSEYSALIGGLQSIRENRPILMVIGDHNLDGAFNIPLFAEKLTRYKLYFRMHDYCGNSAVYYFIPEERTLT